MFRHVSLIVISTAVYGLALGWWRSIEMALYVAAKLPVVFVGSTFVVSTFAWMAGLVVGAGLRYREVLGTFRLFSDDAFANMICVNVRSWPVVALLAVGSAIGLVGIVFVPEFTYPFLWISPFMVVVLLKMLFRSPCALDDIATGNWSRIVRFAVASLLCGLVWEMWNINSFTKWIYAVPYVHRFQYFEMPLLGLFGYIPFGIECLVITDAWMKHTS